MKQSLVLLTFLLASLTHALELPDERDEPFYEYSQSYQDVCIPEKEIKPYTYEVENPVIAKKLVERYGGALLFTRGFGSVEMVTTLKDSKSRLETLLLGTTYVTTCVSTSGFSQNFEVWGTDEVERVLTSWSSVYFYTCGNQLYPNLHVTAVKVLDKMSGLLEVTVYSCATQEDMTKPTITQKQIALDDSVLEAFRAHSGQTISVIDDRRCAESPYVDLSRATTWIQDAQGREHNLGGSHVYTKLRQEKTVFGIHSHGYVLFDIELRGELGGDSYCVSYRSDEHEQSYHLVGESARQALDYITQVHIFGCRKKQEMLPKMYVTSLVRAKYEDQVGVQVYSCFM